MTFHSILPSNSTPWERVVEQTSGERWPLLDIDIIRRAQDPWECPAHLLPWLAYQYGVDLWFDDWSEEHKRRAIAAMPRLKKLKGTPAGFRGYLSLVDVPVTYFKLPPADGYYESAMSAEDRARWLSALPQLRIYRFRDTADVEPGESYADDTMLVDDDDEATFFGVDTGPLLDGERFFLWRNGVETPLPVASTAFRNEAGAQLESVTVALPMPATDAMLIDDDVWSDGWVLPAQEAQDYILTLDLQSIFNPGHPANVVRPTRLQPVTTRFEQVFEPSPVLPGEHFYNATWLFAPDDEDGSYFGEDDGYLHSYRRIYLADSLSPMPDLEGGFCLDDHLWGLPGHHAIVGIDVSEPTEAGPEVFDLDDGYYVAGDFNKLERALEAIRRAQGDTDVIVIDTVTFRQLTFGDRPLLDGSVKLGQMIERNFQ